MSDLLQQELDKVTKLRQSVSVNHSEEDDWHLYLEKVLPKAIILGEGNKVVNKQFVEGDQSLVIVNTDFEIVEQVKPIYEHGEFTNDVKALMKKHKLEFIDIDFARDIDQLKAGIHTTFFIGEIWKNKYLVPSSEAYTEFKEWVDLKNDEEDARLKEERKNKVKR